MTRYTWVVPVKPGKTNNLYEYHKELKGCSTNPTEWDAQKSFHKTIGVTGWNMWVQHTPKGDWLIQSFECTDWNFVWKNLSEQILKGHPIATKIWNFYKETTEADYKDGNWAPNLKEVYKVDVPVSGTKGDSWFATGWAYPLLPGKVNDHWNWCEEEKKNNWKHVIEACQPLGINYCHKWVQTGKFGDFIVYFCEWPCSAWTEVFEGENSFALTPSGRQKFGTGWQCATKNLKEFTGWSGEEFIPELHSLGWNETKTELFATK